MITGQCPQCTRYLGNGEKATCLAFPEGIPDEILLGEHDHTQPFEGDNGFTFIDAGTPIE